MEWQTEEGNDRAEDHAERKTGWEIFVSHKAIVILNRSQPPSGRRETVSSLLFLAVGIGWS